MKVLITCELPPIHPYVYYHFIGVSKEAEVVNSTDAFWNSNLNFDIIHIHWPEHLIGYRIGFQNILILLEDRLKYWRSVGSKIVVTRHNELPHNTDKTTEDLYIKIYDTVYSYSDAIVHHGEYSNAEFRKNRLYSSKKNIVINHPNYLNGIENIVSREEARQKLGIKKESKLFITFGAIRKEKEENNIIKAFKDIQLPNKYLLINNSFSIKNKPGKRTPIKWINYKIKVKRLRAESIFFNPCTEIPNKDIQYCMNAADVVICPRIDTLNSGVIYMALSFGKVVVGPNSGNMTEVLKLTGNPIFTPNDLDSFTDALKEAYSLSKGDLGNRNLEYVKKECDIYILGDKYLDLYKTLINNN